ncbi:MAG: Tm-1-like ATP-binding domain-containing protein, partial [Anaerolineae bacterium]
MTKTVAIIGALDTKGAEFAFLKSEIEKRGCRTFVINVGVLGEPAFTPDVDASVVAEAGGVKLEELIAKRDRGEAMHVMARGIPHVVRKLYDEGKFDAVISMGGGAGTVIATSGMRALPVGVPK